MSSENDELRDKYGRSELGQSCLVARRLVEQGVPYITVNAQGWDTHKKHFESIKKLHEELDAALSTLLQDLSDRGLLDSTVVWCSGEFGRTPRVSWGEPWSGGRSHYGRCFTALVAGGGFEGGKVVGSSDAYGEAVAERPVYPQDFLGSIYERMGIDPEGELPNPLGKSLTILPPPSQQGRLHELYK